jgi:UDP-N-acetyl-D-glucosamine dehydrogenase
MIGRVCVVGAGAIGSLFAGHLARVCEVSVLTRRPEHADALNERGLPIKGTRLLLLGVAYKANVHDTRESPSLEVMRQLLARGGDVAYCDPWVPELELDGERHTSVEWSADEVAGADCVVVLTPHREFDEVPLWDEARLVVDTRNVVPGAPHVSRI